MPIYNVPVTLIEYGREARVEADSVQEARHKARMGDWIEASDPARYKITIVGKAERDDDLTSRV